MKTPECKNSTHILLVSALAGMIIGTVAFAPIWLHHNGQYMDFGDYFVQYVPFVMELKRMIASGNLSWSWNSFLGDSFISAYSYYTVFNPFAWLVALFPNDSILYGTMFATLIKLAISMVSSTLYMKRFCQKNIFALIGALLYTFSGFTLVNTNFYFFLDVIAVFPLLMYGLELLIVEGKRKVYILSVALNAAINYYFFVSTVLLVVLYVFFRLELYKGSSWKIHGYTFRRIVGCSMLGTGIAGIALIPSFYAVLGSGKATETIGTGFELTYWPQLILERIRTLFSPIESNRFHAFFDSSTWSSTGIFIPIFGCSCVLHWCIRKKGWLKNYCILLVICYFVPILNAVFNLFTSTAYTRWLYGMALVFSLITVLWLEEVAEATEYFDKKLLISVSVLTAFLLLMPTAVYLLYKVGINVTNRFASACITEFFMGYSALTIMLILTFVNYSGLWYIAVAKKSTIKKILVMVVIACAINFGTYNIINYDFNSSGYSNNYYLSKALDEVTIKTSNCYEYRIDYPGQIANYSLFKNMPAVNYYNSLQNQGSSRFADAVGIGDGIGDTILLTPVSGGEYTDSLLSVKYYYDYDGNSIIPPGFTYVKTENGVKIYENDNFISMGFAYDSYCLESQLENLSPEEKSIVMLQSLVIRNEDEITVSKYLPSYEIINVSANLGTLATERNKRTCTSFIGTSKGFSAEIELEKANVVFFSVPYDTGWNISVNDVPAETIEVNYGLLGIVCDSGSNQIIATYHTKGLDMGICCSIICIAIWITYEIIFRKRMVGEHVSEK